MYEQAHRVLEFPQPFNQSAFLALFLPAPFPVRRVRRIRAFLIGNPEDAIVLLVKLAQKLAAELFCVLGMGIDYRVKVPNSPAGGKSQRNLYSEFDTEPCCVRF